MGRETENQKSLHQLEMNGEAPLSEADISLFKQEQEKAAKAYQEIVSKLSLPFISFGHKVPDNKAQLKASLDTFRGIMTTASHLPSMNVLEPQFVPGLLGREGGTMESEMEEMTPGSAIVGLSNVDSVATYNID